MSLGTCEHCGKVMREEDYDAHQDTHHPAWATALCDQLEFANKCFDRIASALEGMERRNL